MTYESLHFCMSHTLGPPSTILGGAHMDKPPSNRKHLLPLLSTLFVSLLIALLSTAPFAYAAETAGATAGKSDDVSFTFIDAEGSLDKNGTPLAVIGFSNDIASATVSVSYGDSSEQTLVEATKIVGDSALFSLSSGNGSPSINAVYYAFAANPDTIFVVSVPKVDRSDAANVAANDTQNGASVEAYTVDANGEMQQVNTSLQSGIAALSTISTKSGFKRGIKTIVIDAGHGGSSSGAVGFGLQEKDLTLAIAKACRDELKNYGNARVIMTRDDDTYLELSERAQIALDAGADLFVSMHINSSDASYANGVEVWIPRDSTWYSSFHELGEELGTKVLDRLTNLGLAYRGNKDAYYDWNGTQLYYPDGSHADSLAVIRLCREGGVPGILIEHGFISDQHDASLLSSSSYLKQLGIEDARAIADQLGLVPGGLSLFGFSDVTADTPHSPEIGWLSASGISTGFSDGTFRGMDTVKRQDAAAFLYRMAGSPDYTPSASDKARFSDIDDYTPHAKEIWWLASTGITTGYADGTFRGMGTIKRQDMAAFLQRFTIRFVEPKAANWDVSSSTVSFADVDGSTPHYKEIMWLASVGVTTGFDDGTYRGMADVVRQDMAAFMYRTNNLPSYVAANSEKAAFSDVNDSTPHANEIWWLASSGISSGYSDGTFRGMDTVKRQDAAAFLYRMAGSPSYTPSTSDKARFSDVDESTPHAKEIWWLASVGISTGYGDGTFRGMGTVTRQDMAAFLQRYYNAFSVNGQFKNWIPTTSAMERFLDVDESTTQANSIWWLGATGISTGFEDGFFDPSSEVTRQDLSAFLYRANNLATRTEAPEYSYEIMGSSSYTANQLAGLYKTSGRTYPADTYSTKGAPTIDDFTRIVVAESNAEGVKPEVVMAQIVHETNWLQFGGDVKVEQCNFAGLGATGNGNPGLTFESVSVGVRAQVQHLKAYASVDPLNQECVDPRFKYVTRGVAPTLAKLDGRWAVPGNGYGKSLNAIINQIPIA